MAPSRKIPDGAVAVENFHGVYLLYCVNPKFKGRTYIGYTVEPNRRINQHNMGHNAGGARRTSNRGPWEMVLIIHGFLEKIAALKFEWAWQHPDVSRSLRGCLSTKKSSESAYLYKLRILANMLSVGPWKRLPLTIQWLDSTYEKLFPADKPPPFHMAICYGPVKAVKVNLPAFTDEESSQSNMCFLCKKDAKVSEMLLCIQPQCCLVAHTICLAKEFLRDEKDEIIPVEGYCPRCKSKFLWGDLVRKKIGCYVELQLNNSVSDVSSICDASSDVSSVSDASSLSDLLQRHQCKSIVGPTTRLNI